MYGGTGLYPGMGGSGVEVIGGGATFPGIGDAFDDCGEPGGACGDGLQRVSQVRLLLVNWFNVVA
jgi:hypothetical protein